MTQATASKPIPSWLSLNDSGVTVTLKGAANIGGVLTDKLTMRTPTVRDERAATAAANGDAMVYEINLLCSLLQATEQELGALSTRNYKRLMAGYFRMDEEDEL
ncbi:phage tail assembly protein [Pseudomonas sp. PDM07]|uniref:phage tail assembly protein n=1 Tax=Pseudomonas sp. PDM07 TaxID=2769264 RepID=UPI001781C878|nr:phage tail assembly protein [Pseudomonas sp. PDM07]MBD9616776.1 phage tail assembly protein [Pseudomonas sp. PDM07]